MSVTGISSNLFNYLNQTSNEVKQPTPNMQQLKQDLHQLGQDLKAGNLSAAQADFATLQQIGPAGLSNPSIQPKNPLWQVFNQLSEDLQAGDLTAAQQDYLKLQQTFQGQGVQGAGHHEVGRQIQQLLQKLGQALQSGDLSDAQKAFAMLKQDLQHMAESRGHGAPPSPAASTVSVTA